MRSTRLAILAIGILAACSTAPAFAASPTVEQPNPRSVDVAPAVSIDSVLVVTHVDSFGVSLRGEAVVARAVTVATSPDSSIDVIAISYLAARSRLSHAKPVDNRPMIATRPRSSRASVGNTPARSASDTLFRRLT